MKKVVSLMLAALFVMGTVGCTVVTVKKAPPGQIKKVKKNNPPGQQKKVIIKEKH